MAKIEGMQEVAIKDLIPYERNAKLHPNDQVELIAESIKKFGFLTPCLIDKDGNVIAGHGRIEAAKKLGMVKVPCVKINDLTEEQRRAYILADNKLTELGGWDMNIVFEELDFLKDMDFDISLIGFDFDIDSLDDSEVKEDNYQEPNHIEPRAKLGDIWRLGEHRLMCGDSTSVTDVEKLVDGAKVDLVLTDPPYGISVVGDNGEVGAKFGIAKKGSYSKVIADDTTETAQLSFSILKSISDRQIIWGGNYFTEFLPFSDGWLIWDKRVDSGIRNTFADGEMAWCSFHTPVRIYHQLWIGMIREGEHEKRVHPTQKPLNMLCDILKDFTNEKDSVLDVFGGSGSTLIACEQLNRKCFMMELDPHYIDVIIDRWEKFTGEKAYLLK